MIEFIANSLSPARVVMVQLLESEKIAKVIVPDNQLSLAIGKEGQNARLAAKLTGWKIDIKSQSQSMDMIDELIDEMGNDFDEQDDQFAEEIEFLMRQRKVPMRMCVGCREDAQTLADS